MVRWLTMLLIWIALALSAAGARGSEAVSDQEIERLSAELEHKDFQKREEAAAALAKLPANAYDQLVRARYLSKSEEAQVRLDKVLTGIEVKLLVDATPEQSLAARRRILSRGPGMAPLLKAALKNAQTDQAQTRLKSVLFAIATQEFEEQVVPMADHALQRAAELRRELKDEQVVAVTNRRLASSLGNSLYLDNRWTSDPYAELCYWNFPKGNREYSGSVSLSLYDASIEYSFLGGQENGVWKLGQADYAAIKTLADAKGKPVWQTDRRPVGFQVQDVFIEHCLEKRDGVDRYAKFKILEFKANEYMIIQWAEIKKE